MRGDILGLERRRRWSDEEKLGIVLSVGVAGATVTQVAQRHEVTRQQLYAWRHELKKKGLLSPVVSRMWWKLPSSGLRACNDGSSQAARSRDIGSRGWDRVSQPSTFRIWI